MFVKTMCVFAFALVAGLSAPVVDLGRGAADLVDRGEGGGGDDGKGDSCFEWDDGDAWGYSCGPSDWATCWVNDDASVDCEDSDDNEWTEPRSGAPFYYPCCSRGADGTCLWRALVCSKKAPKPDTDADCSPCLNGCTNGVCN